MSNQFAVNIPAGGFVFPGTHTSKKLSYILASNYSTGEQIQQQTSGISPDILTTQSGTQASREESRQCPYP